MSKVNLEDAFGLFRESIVEPSDEQKRIYTDELVMWLGVYQALEEQSCRGSLEELGNPRVFELFGDCKRKWSGKKISSNVSALIQARQEIKLETLQEALCSLHQHIRKGHLWRGYRVIGTDGSTVSLNKSNPKLLRAYPGGRDHKGKSRWPLVHMVLLIDLLEGTVVTGNLGAKYGKNAVSEQSMALELMNYIDEKAVLVGDRNFGTFQMAKEYSECGVKVLYRLTKTVAKFLAGGEELSDGLDREVAWKPTTAVRNKHGYEKEDEVRGRLIVRKFKTKKEEVEVSLFTTLEEGSVDELIELYKKRWCFEEDLKTMKLQLKLKDVQAETKASVDVEIFCKLLAFNITRGIILLAVEGTEIDPRRISFKSAFRIVRRYFPAYEEQRSQAAKQKILEIMLERIRLVQNPLRPGRSNKRQVYRRRPGRYKTLSSRL